MMPESHYPSSQSFHLLFLIFLDVLGFIVISTKKK